MSKLVVGVDCKLAEYDAKLVGDFPQAQFCRVYFSPGEGFASWSAARIANLPATVAPWPSWKDWPSDSTVRGWINAFLDAMPDRLTVAPLIPELGISMFLTHFHEPEGGPVSIVELARRYGVIYSTVRAHPNGRLVWVVPIQANIWTDLNNGGDVTTWWVGADNCDAAGLDLYAKSWHSTYDDPATVLQMGLTLSAYARKPLIVPELGAFKLPYDPDGSKRANWITQITNLMANNGVAGVAWWDTFDNASPPKDFSLTDPPSAAAWSALFAQRGLPDVDRHPFGITMADALIADGSGHAATLETGTVTFWSDRDTGTQYTDLAATKDGPTAFDHIVTGDGGDSRVPYGWFDEIWGPPGVLGMWAQPPGDGARLFIISRDVVKYGDQLNTIDAKVDAHVGDHAAHPAALANLGDVQVGTPDTRSDQTVLTWTRTGPSTGYFGLSPSQAAGALLLNPPLSGGSYVGNNVTLPTEWASQGGNGNPWTTVLIPWSAGDDNPDIWQFKAIQAGGGSSIVRTTSINGNGELRVAPSYRSRVGFRAFEANSIAGGPSTGSYAEMSTNPPVGVSREKLAAWYGTEHPTMPGWQVNTRTLWAQQGVQAGGNFNGLLPALYVGVQPGSTVGPPTSGTWVAGMIVKDSQGTDWLCTVGGTPGTWVGGNGFNVSAWQDVTLGTSMSHGSEHASSRQEGPNGRMKGILTAGATIASGATIATIAAPSHLPPRTQIGGVVRSSSGGVKATITSAGALSINAGLNSGDSVWLDFLTWPLS